MHPRLSRAAARHALLLVATLSLSSRAGAEPPSDARLAMPLDRDTIIRGVVERNPTAHVGEMRVRAIAEQARAEGKLPPPEAMLQIWQVPLARPYAIGEQMVMIGVGQTFPAPGLLGARALAKQEETSVERAMSDERLRQVAREAAHAFADYVEAAESHRIHETHFEIAHRVLEIAHARYSSGGPLTDVTGAEMELTRVEADLMSDSGRMSSARAHINALLGRAPSASLGAPVPTEPAISPWDDAALVAKAAENRPELRAREAEIRVKRLEVRAAEREATIPSFSVAALYFPPTSAMPQHGYGVNTSVSLPWIWGAARQKVDASSASLAAAAAGARAARLPIDSEVLTAGANARSAALRLQVIRDRVLPASRRGFEAAWSGYESGRTDALTLQNARRAAVDAEETLVKARSALDHAQAELDAAVGAPIPTIPIGRFDERILEVDHVR